jgi:glyoxylase-like metal-dependent hydrolase (beta-lactamase superfamily II)
MYGNRGISEVKPGVKIIENLYGFQQLPNMDCNVYVLKAEKKTGEDYDLMIIDSGNGVNSKNLVEGMKEIDLDPTKVVKICVTHEHVDHILGIYNLPDLLGRKPEILAMGNTTRIIREANRHVIVPPMFSIDLSEFNIQIVPLEVTDIKEGDIIEFGEFKLQALYTPGHSTGSMTLYETNHKLLFPGDLIFIGGSFGRFDFPGGSLPELKKSIKRMKEEFDVAIICPGHMNFSKNGNIEIRKAHRILNSFY